MDQLRWETVFEEVPVPLSVVDPDGRQLAGNRAYRDLFGVGDGALVDLTAAGLTAAGLTHPDDRDRTRAYLLQLRHGNDDVVIEKRYLRPDGTTFVGDLHARRVADAGGNATMLLGAIIDVTEARQDAAALAEARDAAERASRAKSTFVARVSHDLRTPLHALIGYTELLERLVDGQAAAQLAELIHKQAESLQHLIDDLLDLSAIESGRLEMRHAPCDLRALVAECVDAVSVAVDTTGLVIRSAVADDVPARIVTDDRRVREVLNNLINNAVKYTPWGSIDVIARVDAGAVRIEVSDTGPGIDPNYLDTLFDAFRQAGTRLARTESTTGLGLAIVKQLVELLGGTVGVESELGLGSTFWFTLPAEVEGGRPRVAVLDGRGATAAASRPARVLVVDDSDTNLELIEQQLTTLGHVPVLARDARDALGRLDDAIDLVLMDVNMPDVDGLQATQWIRAAGWRTPVVALTAAAMAADRAACARAGMDGFLAKPIGLSGLAEAVAQWTQGRTAAAPAPAPATGYEGPLEGLVADAGVAAAVSVATSYLRESEHRLSELRAAADTGDDDAFVRQAHTLASTSRLVGGTDVAALCATAERAGIAGTDVDALWPRLDDAYRALRARLIAALVALDGAP